MGAMRKQSDQLFGEFERAIDEFFDEFLDRWQCGVGEQFADAEIVDYADRYEIRLVAEGVDPEKIEVESLGRRLTVRASGDRTAIWKRLLPLPRMSTRRQHPRDG